MFRLLAGLTRAHCRDVREEGHRRHAERGIIDLAVKDVSCTRRLGTRAEVLGLPLVTSSARSDSPSASSVSSSTLGVIAQGR